MIEYRPKEHTELVDFIAENDLRRETSERIHRVAVGDMVIDRWCPDTRSDGRETRGHFSLPIAQSNHGDKRGSVKHAEDDKIPKREFCYRPDGGFARWSVSRSLPMRFGFCVTKKSVARGIER